MKLKLTDTQLVLLSAVARRQDGAIELGPKLKGNASSKVLGRLLSEGLIDEIPAAANRDSRSRSGLSVPAGG
jgi:hypothetical protein